MKESRAAMPPIPTDAELVDQVLAEKKAEVMDQLRAMLRGTPEPMRRGVVPNSWYPKERTAPTTAMIAGFEVPLTDPVGAAGGSLLAEALGESVPSPDELMARPALVAAEDSVSRVSEQVGLARPSGPAEKLAAMFAQMTPEARADLARLLSGTSRDRRSKPFTTGQITAGAADVVPAGEIRPAAITAERAGLDESELDRLPAHQRAWVRRGKR